MTISTDDIREGYEPFNSNDLDALVNQFHPEGVYFQDESGQMAKGHAEIRGVMEGWKTFFTGAHIDMENIQIKEVPAMAGDVRGAVQCFVVDFTGVGVYDVTIPGLEQVAPATKRMVRLPVGETIWVDKEGKYLQVKNAIQVTALQ
jgi:hypothetical protein